jgi:hypothetical protein
MATIIVESLLDPLWQIGGGIGIIVLTALMLTLALRSSDTDPRSKDAHGDEGSWLKNAGAFHHRQVH